MDSEVMELSRQVRSALREGAPGLVEFKRCFQQACAEFEAGRDSEGRQAVLVVVPHLRQFTHFFHGLLLSSGVFLTESDMQDWQRLGARFSEALGRFNQAWENGDVAAVCDLLRFDFCELMDACARAFDHFEKSLPIEVAA